jgi:hypothetical protein
MHSEKQRQMNCTASNFTSCAGPRGSAISVNNSASTGFVRYVTVVSCMGETGIDSSATTSPTVQNCNIYNNSLSQGAVYTRGTGISISNCVFLNNAKDIAFSGSPSSNSVSVEDCVFSTVEELTELCYTKTRNAFAQWTAIPSILNYHPLSCTVTTSRSNIRSLTKTRSASPAGTPSLAFIRTANLMSAAPPASADIGSSLSMTGSGTGAISARVPFSPVLEPTAIAPTASAGASAMRASADIGTSLSMTGSGTGAISARVAFSPVLEPTAITRTASADGSSGYRGSEVLEGDSGGPFPASSGWRASAGLAHSLPIAGSGALNSAGGEVSRAPEATAAAAGTAGAGGSDQWRASEALEWNSGMAERNSEVIAHTKVPPSECSRSDEFANSDTAGETATIRPSAVHPPTPPFSPRRRPKLLRERRIRPRLVNWGI